MPFVPKAQGGSFKPKEDDKNFGEKTADFLGFTAFGKGIATLGGANKQLEAANALAEKAQADALARRKANAAAGRDTSRLDAALQRSLQSVRQTDAVKKSIETGGGLTNREVIGSAINVAASLPAGFGGITAAKTSFRPLAKGAITGTLANQGLKGGFKKAAGMLAAEGAVAGGLGGLGFGLMDKEKDAMGVAGSALGGAALGSVLAPAIGAAAIPVARAIGRAGNPAIRAAERQAKLDKLVGAVSQGKTQQEIDAAKAAYGAIDTEGVQTFTDLKDRLDDQIAETANGLDEVLATNPTKKTLDTFTAKVKVGDETVEYNYVDDAFAQLEDFYIKTNDVPGQTRLAQKRARAEAEGLTIKEVNDLAKEHGANLNAYNANGQLASGLSRQAAENTRKGLKATARQEFNDPLYNAADGEISNLIKARDAAEAMMKEVQKLQNKIKDRSLGERAGRLGFQLLDLFTLRGLSGFTQAALGRGTGLKTFNALDLERQLQKNLKEVQKILDRDVPAESIVDELERYIQRQSQSALPASQPNTSSAASTAKNVPIQAGIPQAIPPVNPRPVDSMLPSTGVPIRDADAVRLPVARQMNVVDESVPGVVTPEIRRSPEELPVIDAGSVPKKRSANLPVAAVSPTSPKGLPAIPGTKLYGGAAGITPETDENGNVVGVGYNPALGVAGLAGGKIASDALNNPAAVKKAFEGFQDISTKLLEKLKGRSTVSKQFISDLTNSPDLKQPEKDLIRRLLDETTPQSDHFGQADEMVPKFSYIEDTKGYTAKVRAGDEIGDLSPNEYWHGTNANLFDTFKGNKPVFLTKDSGFANYYAKVKQQDTAKGSEKILRASVSPDVKILDSSNIDSVSAKLPDQIIVQDRWRQETPLTRDEFLKAFKETGNWELIERSRGVDNKSILTILKRAGFDGVNMKENGDITTVIFDPKKVSLGKKEVSDQIDVPTFAEKVKAELLPLERKPGGNGYEYVNLPDELRGPVASYSTHTYGSPVKTSAGSVHPELNAGDNYFGHTRVEDLPNSADDLDTTNPFADPLGGTTRRVIEVQSDLFQKGRLEGETESAFRNMDADEIAEMKKYDQQQYKVYEESLKRNAEVAKLDPYKNNAAHFRMIREEVKQAALDGKTKLQFPTGETAMKIEGLGSTNNWFRDPGLSDAQVNSMSIADVNRAYRNESLTPEALKVGETVRQGGHGGEWIITDVLGDGKFMATPKDDLDNLSEDFSDLGLSGPDDVMEALAAGNKEVIELINENTNTESFDISGKIDTENPIYRFYNKDVRKYLTSKYDAKEIVDPQGVSWIEVDLKGKGYGKLPVEAFGVLGTAGLGTAAINSKEN